MKGNCRRREGEWKWKEKRSQGGGRKKGSEREENWKAWEKGRMKG